MKLTCSLEFGMLFLSIILPCELFSRTISEQEWHNTTKIYQELKGFCVLSWFVIGSSWP